MQMIPVTQARERGKCQEEVKALGEVLLGVEEAGAGGENHWRQKLPRGREKAEKLEKERELEEALSEKQNR